MMDWFTAKQWLFICVLETGAIAYLLWKLYQFAKEARADRATIAKLILALGKGLNVDLSEVIKNV